MQNETNMIATKQTNERARISIGMYCVTLLKILTMFYINNYTYMLGYGALQKFFKRGFFDDDHSKMN